MRHDDEIKIVDMFRNVVVESLQNLRQKPLLQKKDFERSWPSGRQRQPVITFQPPAGGIREIPCPDRPQGAHMAVVDVLESRRDALSRDENAANSKKSAASRTSYFLREILHDLWH